MSKIIFSVRSQTFDIKTNRPWSYDSDTCDACENMSETMNPFMTCTSYKTIPCWYWEEINSDNEQLQLEVGEIVEMRHIERENIIDQKKVGRALDSDSSAPGSCRALL